MTILRKKRLKDWLLLIFGQHGADLAGCKVRLSEELDGKVSFFKVDVDENQATAEKFGVMSIPTMIIQKDGKVVDTVVGYHEKDALKKIIEKYL